MTDGSILGPARHLRDEKNFTSAKFFAFFAREDATTEDATTAQVAKVCDYALVYAEKKNDGDAPYSVSFTATQSGDVIVQLHPHSQLERAVRHERQAQATEPPASASPAAPPAPAAEPPAAEPATNMTKRGQQQRGKGRSASGRANAGPRLVDKNALSARGGGPSRQSRSPSPDSPPAKRASSADSSGYDTDLPDEVQQEAAGWVKVGYYTN
ncbi:hypothetical protein EMIHUDRAFT_232027 [Emiliania huxleyi CCMP1516]|uniref:Uncharacterized protein n=2 Tax=Emiliania huxleyi TaxID=2903 RepID=A0A0D3K6N2_EMIH1|nr:hypothetical protein EMIHUDRAFT_232027 [Emiliania huxleyi CCMP1516]EOD31417.1 hypothetical protein EMIHUDRAFT_232027 [Emiliania huxleyi CCMP1516]|eukprot:XP_005783846.1 hypothetical protein EMIHUDRAFT_232027 [Emiliania huxleyi CCMP1516]